MFSRKMEAVEEHRKPSEGSRFRNLYEKSEPAPGLVLLGSVCAGGECGASVPIDGNEKNRVLRTEMLCVEENIGFQDLGGFRSDECVCVENSEVDVAKEFFDSVDGFDLGGEFGEVEGCVENSESEIDLVKQFFDTLNGVGLGGEFGEELEDCLENSEIDVVKPFFGTLNGVGLGGEFGEELEDCVENYEIDVLKQFFDTLNGVGIGGEFGEELEDCKDSNLMMRVEDGGAEGEIGDLDHEGYGSFSVGDFVWGKIKGYPWWPGQIYDPSDASESAAKMYQKGKILVAFSDGFFAWCLSSQLKPFDEDCEEMLKQSKSKRFVASVEKALSDVGKLLELKMTCSCVRRGDLGWPLAENNGIKEGVPVPERAISFSITEFEPAEFVSNLKDVARAASSGGVLDLLIMKSILSGFYSAKGGYRLAEYHEPCGIEAMCVSSQKLPGTKRKSISFEPVILCKDLNQNGSFVIDKSEEEEEPVKSKKRRNVVSSGSATLIAEFGPGCSLPTKTQLIAAYKDFGDLVEDETDMWYNNSCARVVFARSSDAERAFKSSMQASPLGDAGKVTFRLHYNNSVASSEFETPNKTSHSKAFAAVPSNNAEASQLCFIQLKLETMAAMVKQSDGKVSGTLKSNLECGMRGLLERVSAMGW